MFQIFFVIILFLLFCKPDPLPKYETYLYKPTSKGVGKDLKEYINKIEVENNIHYSKNSNPTAYIPPMCCIPKTLDVNNKAHNPCYSCHTKGETPNS
jgi:transcription initiation factor IIE alpha subunit